MKVIVVNKKGGIDIPDGGIFFMVWVFCYS